jgi:hypothetical protein
MNVKVTVPTVARKTNPHANEARHRADRGRVPPREPRRPRLVIAWLGLAQGILVGLLVAVAVIGTYLQVLGPWQRRWGATDGEVRRAMPGDALLRPDAPSTMRAMAIDAPPEEVFPWLLQIGCGPLSRA